MPANTNNTPFTWTDAQWLNTQVANCTERSTEAVATVAQALALINSLKRGTQLLSKISGVNLNPSITLTYTSLVNTFSVGSAITDVNGSTAIIVSDNGSNSMTLTNVSLAPGFNMMEGAIQESPGSGTAVVNTFNWGDLAIALTGGNTFIITDIVLTNVSQGLTNVQDGEWWQSAQRSGNQVAGEIGLPGILQTASNIESTHSMRNKNVVFQTQKLTIPINTPLLWIGTYPTNSINNLNTCTSPIYFTVSTTEGTVATCDMYIYGYVLN